jgi:Ca2+-binding EF-hand superfamily protein
LWSAFKYFESSTDSGYISVDSIIDATKEHNLPVNEEAINKEFQDLQKKGKKLNFEEFKKMIYK